MITFIEWLREQIFYEHADVIRPDDVIDQLTNTQLLERFAEYQKAQADK